MNKYAVKLLSLIMLSIPLHVKAAEPSHFYFGLGWGSYAFDIQNSTTTYSSASGLSLALGYDFNDFLAAEGSYIAPDIFDATGGTDQVIDYAASLFLRANLRFERSTLFFLAGGSSLGVTNAGYDDAGVAYGMGIDFFGSKNTALTMKYIKYLDSETTVGSNEVKLDGITLGFTHYFDTPRFSNRY